ncbi:cytochrome c oxidase subunit 4 [Rathayibacter iranicus]|uniref:Cytochrome c oxidase polypeptide 4 n=2 Tax=Rathayibacter iranicus TaxID=59737 RepID=A0AAD1AAZ0_9MICO|nr:cytochrome c oxidase subunit 4 [Rathayibacter iranicus]AZZ54876.1 cytochrome c oxidase subunit 4 [Rathayibacter iranicus]MWV31451.1 cytochrome c oxidase subunit 4 [Rathayibacter iranicus NCPPB 2253 = VKM Ac-1602]PPI50286.1 cytochrome c oxidase subunit IV [Rathayibacter iranicus]PPI62499.1 cytochrome c oxidase subunit IV [Rathayibacter iranicus]PPI73558.1 cytochrome c oxidase subunit IV [Rathayibacter iranicus]
MRANVTLFWLLAGFFLLADIVYIAWSLIDTGQVEWVGAVAIGLSSVLGAFIAFYVGRVHSAQGAELPEDRLDADIDDGDPELGFFSPWSWWPLILGGSAALGFLGLAVGFWITYIAVGLFLVAIAGWVYEYYRGYFAR